MAEACAQLGRIDEAFAHLQRAVTMRDPTAPSLVFEPNFAPLRDDHRFDELKRRVGLG